jgi:hypothetical protein
VIEQTMPTGNVGLLIVQDKTDSSDKTVDLYVQSHSSIAIPQLPWAYSIDGVISSWQSFNFTDSVLPQHLGLIHVGYAESFILHLGNTGTTQLGGPTDFEVQLNQSGVRTISLKVDGEWKKAIPYVNVAGVWKPAAPFVMSGSIWKPAT